MITPFQIATFFIYSIAIVLAIYFSTSIAEEGVGAFVKILSFMGGAAWILFGSRIWWLPLFWGIGFGGVFWVGFKIYAQEAALALALVTVVPALILQRQRLRPRPEGLPWGFHLLFAYLAVECLFSCVVFGNRGLLGIGGIFRAYFYALWPYPFLIGFSLYGFSQNIRWGLHALQIGYRFRIAMVFATFLNPGFLYLPGVNFVLPGSTAGGLSDLRVSGLGMVMVSLALLFSKRGIFLSARTFYFTGIQAFRVLIGVMALLFGGGRSSVIECAFAFLFAAVYSRKWVVLGIVLILGIGIVSWVNLTPQILDKLPERVGRAVSILILKDAPTEVENLKGSDLGASDMWHKRLREIALQRWTASPVSLFFGTGIRSFDVSVAQDFSSPDIFEESLENSANVGAYETAVWDVLAVSGLVGFVLYYLLIYQLVRQIWRLRAIADQDGFGRVLVFFSLCQVTIWVLSSYLSGSWPSFELMMLGVTVIYLQDRANEQEILQPAREAIPFPELMKS